MRGRQRADRQSTVRRGTEPAVKRACAVAKMALRGARRGVVAACGGGRLVVCGRPSLGCLVVPLPPDTPCPSRIWLQEPDLSLVWSVSFLPLPRLDDRDPSCGMARAALHPCSTSLRPSLNSTLLLHPFALAAVTHVQA